MFAMSRGICSISFLNLKIPYVKRSKVDCTVNLKDYEKIGLTKKDLPLHRPSPSFPLRFYPSGEFSYSCCNPCQKTSFFLEPSMSWKVETNNWLLPQMVNEKQSLFLELESATA